MERDTATEILALAGHPDLGDHRRFRAAAGLVHHLRRGRRTGATVGMLAENLSGLRSTLSDPPSGIVCLLTWHGHLVAERTEVTVTNREWTTFPLGTWFELDAVDGIFRIRETLSGVSLAEVRILADYLEELSDNVCEDVRHIAHLLAPVAPHHVEPVCTAESDDPLDHVAFQKC